MCVHVYGHVHVCACVCMCMCMRMVIYSCVSPSINTCIHTSLTESRPRCVFAGICLAGGQGSFLKEIRVRLGVYTYGNIGRHRARGELPAYLHVLFFWARGELPAHPQGGRVTSVFPLL